MAKIKADMSEAVFRRLLDLAIKYANLPDDALPPPPPSPWYWWRAPCPPYTQHMEG